MTPGLVGIVLAVGATAALEGDEHAFGRRAAAPIRTGVDPDADHHSGDGAYGRFDGDLDVELGAGTSINLTDGEAGLGLRTSARWFSTAGPYVHYVESLEHPRGFERRLGLGLELTPLFLLRWSQGLERGPAFLDLTLDSLSLGLGLALTQPLGRGFAADQGFELSLGVGVPLLARAPGPWLSLRAGLVLPSGEPGAASLIALFSWHFMLPSPLVSAD